MEMDLIDLEKILRDKFAQFNSETSTIHRSEELLVRTIDLYLKW